MKIMITCLFLLIFFVGTLFAQEESYRPGLFFRENWKETPAEIPLSQKHVDNNELLVNLYGAGQDSLKKSNHPQPVDDPVSYTHLRAHETKANLVCRLLLE